MMFFTKMLTLALAASPCFAKVGSQRSRALSLQGYFRFTPKTQVTDHAAIDLDQQEIEMHLSDDSKEYQKARMMYENGAHSKSYAVLTLTAPLTTSLTAGTAVNVGTETVGKVYTNANSGDQSISIQYHTSNDHATYVGCQVGGSSEPTTDGCLVPNGSISIGSVDLAYTDVVNRNGRTIRGFATNDSKHRKNGSGDYYTDFDDFQEYYGSVNYADEWISAALSGTGTSFANGNANFAASSDAAREQAVKKGTAYLAIFMYVIRELEDALDDCERGCDVDECNDDAVHALDEAVAFYSGSLMVTGGGDGILLYALAEKRCENFDTCKENGVSQVNDEIFSHFIRMQDFLVKEQCDSARKEKESLVDLMYVPMIQGALRYAYFSGEQDDQSEKSEAEGATFAAAVLPKVTKCNARDAETIYDNLKIGNTSPADFTAVKRAFENNYGCMGITCQDVGGLSDGSQYLPNAQPCSSSFMATVGMALGMAALTVAALF